VVTVPKEKLGYTKLLFQKKYRNPRLKIICGGKTRKLSIDAALKTLEEENQPPQYILIHDAVRPFISKTMIRAVCASAIHYDGAIIGVPAADLTAKINQCRFIMSCPSKSHTYLLHTPQCFRFKLIQRAHALSQNPKYNLTDTAELVKTHFPKSKIKVVTDAGPNLKLTYPIDVKIFKILLHK